MRHLILLLVFASATFSISANDFDILNIRTMYQQASKNEQSCEDLLQLLENKTKEQSPVLYGYRASATMMMAKYAWNPYQKMKYFEKGKEMLEDAIQEDQSSIELKYLRFTIQTNAPSFLGYHNKIESDKNFLIAGVTQLQDNILKELITTYLTTNIELSEKEIKKIKND